MYFTILTNELTYLKSEYILFSKIVCRSVDEKKLHFLPETETETERKKKKKKMRRRGEEKEAKEK